MAKITYDSSKPFKERIIEAIKSTWNVRPDLLTVSKEGPYAVFREFIMPGKIKVDHTDGIGTKGWLHYQMGTFEAAAQDAFAMNANDLILMGITPYRLQGHLVIEKDDHEAIVNVVEALSKICVKHRVVYTGGESAILNTIKGFELGMTMVGVADRVVLPNVQAGDVVIGIKSNGLHSNGFTFLRSLFMEDHKMKLTDKLYDGVTLGEELTKPTVVYVNSVLKVVDKHFDSIHGMMHMTGGASTKILDIIPKNLDVKINRTHSLKHQKIFDIVKEKSGWDDAQMYKNFNCGVGFTLIVKKDSAQDILKIIREQFDADIIGEVISGTGKVTVDSMFSDKTVEFKL